MHRRIHHISYRRQCENFSAMLIVLIIISLCALREFGVEATLQVFFEDIIINQLDTKYFDPDKTTAYIAEDEESEENTISTTLELIKKPPADAQGRFSLTGMSMGKYTVPTGVDLRMGLCEMLNEPIILGPFFAVLGFSSDSCPPEPGTYSQEGYKLPVEALPDEFPENKYLVYFEISLKGKPLLGANVYATIQSD